MKADKIASKSPLWLHPSGQWCKKCRGTNFYFGKDLEAALKRYAVEWDDIKAGRPRHARDEEPVTVAYICNSYLTRMEQMRDMGEITPKYFMELYHLVSELIDTFGNGRSVTSLVPSDFAGLKARVAKRRGPIGLKTFITRAKSIFTHGYNSGLLNVPMRFGDGFEAPPRRSIRLEKAKAGPRLLEREDVLKILALANPMLKAQMLLGLNCGFGSTDCAVLTRRDLKNRPGWICLVRSKTGASRECPLWPETIEALKETEKARALPKEKQYADLVFITHQGVQAVTFNGKSTKDSIGKAFKFTAEAAKVKLPKQSSFYTLRRIFRTVADATGDQRAIARIMGHELGDMGSHYVEQIGDERLKKVTDHVRKWLWRASGSRKKGRALNMLV